LKRKAIRQEKNPDDGPGVPLWKRQKSSNYVRGKPFSGSMATGRERISTKPEEERKEI